jgi:hypothetical protein
MRVDAVVRLGLRRAEVNMLQTPLPPEISAASDRKLTPQQALVLAWATWTTLLVIPYVLWLSALHAAINASDASGFAVADAWFPVLMCYLLIAVPVAIFWRSHLFKPYWRGQTVAPRAYLGGMVTLWATLAFGGAIASTVCLATATLTPNIVPASFALFLYLLLCPEGSAMTEHSGASDDAELYSEPR